MISAPRSSDRSLYFGEFKWDGTTPSGTSIKFQFRSSNSSKNLESSQFIGPDGTPASYYTKNIQAIQSYHNGSRWFQYQAILTTSILSITPTLKSVTINYNILQNISILSPSGGENWTDLHNITWAANDDDNDTLAYDIFLENESMSVRLVGSLSNETREWAWNTSAIPNGTYRIKVMAHDDNPSIPLVVNATSGNFTIYHPPPPNHPPHVALISPANNSIINNTSVRLIWKGTDIDGNRVTYTCRYSENPHFQGAVSSNVTESDFIDIANLTDNMTYYWTVNADDGIMNYTDVPVEIWSFTVRLSHPPVNHPPRITSKPPSIVMVDDSYEYNITATDEDNDNITFTMVQAPNNMSINMTSGRMHWIPVVSDIGNKIIIVQASDGKGGIDEQTFTITVLARPLPEKPRCTISSPINGSKVSGRVQISGTAMNGSIPITSIQVRIDGGRWMNAIGLANWTITVDMSKSGNGKHMLEARAFDGDLYSDPATIDVKVNNPQPRVYVEGAYWWMAIIIILVVVSIIIILRFRMK